MIDKCQHRLDYEQEMDYWPEGEPCVRCWAETARPVFDAAMAWLAEIETDLATYGPGDWQEDCLYPCEKALLDACRRAKEGG